MAEKFHAISLLGMANTRLKDYFDLWVLLGESALDPSELRRAIEATFARRNINLPKELPTGLSDAFVNDASKDAQWKAFLRKKRLEPVALTDVVTRLRAGLRAMGLS